MKQPLAYLNGNRIPTAELTISIADAGFVQGVTVAEQLRTFAGMLFRLDEHMQRLQNSLRIIGVSVPGGLEQLVDEARELVAYNHQFLTSGDDLGLSIFVTPGLLGLYGQEGNQGPTVAMHTYPVAFATFSHLYEQGQRLATVTTRQIPEACWPTALKCRSRMHYYLADREAQAKDRLARALLMDLDGFVTEASTANVLLYCEDSGFVSPRAEKILPGISVATLKEIANTLQIPWTEADVTVEDVKSANEVFLSSTSPCVVPVQSIDGVSIGDGRPGKMFRRLIAAWNSIVGVDIVEQARSFSLRGPVGNR